MLVRKFTVRLLLRSHTIWNIPRDNDFVVEFTQEDSFVGAGARTHSIHFPRKIANGAASTSPGHCADFFLRDEGGGMRDETARLLTCSGLAPCFHLFHDRDEHGG
jgi:hypothetical protein